MTASLESPPRLSVVKKPETTPIPEPNLEELIARAKAKFESGNREFIAAGRILGEAEALDKKKFAAQLANSQLDKTQSNKLIAVSAAADAMPCPDVADKLSPHLLIQLGQKTNQAALDAITDDDTQVSVVLKMKKLRAPAAHSEKKSIRLVGNHKGGVPKLVIELPARPENVEIYNDCQESGTHTTKWMMDLLALKRDSSERSPSIAKVDDSPLTNDSQQLELTTITDSGAAIDYTQPIPLPSPAIENPTEQEVAQVELDAYLEAQAQEIAPFVQNIVPLLSSSITHDFVPLPEVVDELDLIDEPSSATVTGDTQGIDDISSVEEISPSLPSSTPSTDRYKQGWHVGDQVIANSVLPWFQTWGEEKPMTINTVQGNSGEIQSLNVIRHDGQSAMSFGNWIESVRLASPQTQELECGRETLPQTPIVQTEEVTQTETPDYGNLSKMLLKTKNWEKVSELVQKNADTLSKAIANWSLEQKSELIAIAIAYIEANPKAIRYHEIDWMPLDELKQVFHKLSFLVHDITSGLAAPWHEECTFIDVTSLGNDDDEVWRFTSGGQEIQVWSREDIEVVAF